MWQNGSAPNVPAVDCCVAYHTDLPRASLGQVNAFLKLCGPIYDASSGSKMRLWYFLWNATTLLTSR